MVATDSTIVGRDADLAAECSTGWRATAAHWSRRRGGNRQDDDLARSTGAGSVAPRFADRSATDDRGRPVVRGVTGFVAAAYEEVDTGSSQAKGARRGAQRERTAKDPRTTSMGFVGVPRASKSAPRGGRRRRRAMARPRPRIGPSSSWSRLPPRVSFWSSGGPKVPATCPRSHTASRAPRSKESRYIP